MRVSCLWSYLKKDGFKVTPHPPLYGDLSHKGRGKDFNFSCKWASQKLHTALLMILLTTLLKKSTGISYVDLSALAVCSNKRIYRHKVFEGLAARGKTTKGWFFGFKIHLIVTGKGDLVRVKLTRGNVDDRAVVDQMTDGLTGWLFGDKGYISKALFLRLYRHGLKLVTGIRKGMRNQLIPLKEKILLRKRSVIETIFDYLKNKLQLEHTRHRSPVNAFIHILSVLIVYQLKPTKPSISEKGLTYA